MTCRATFTVVVPSVVGFSQGGKRRINMPSTINIKTLRCHMGRIVDRVQRGEDFVVLYRSRPAFRIVPVKGAFTHGSGEGDSLYEAEAVGTSSDEVQAAGRDRVPYSLR